MADLYNLLDELDEHENEDAFVKERPSMAPTEATEGESEWGSPGRSEAEVPLALQEARLQYEEEAENEGDASGGSRGVREDDAELPGLGASSGRHGV